MRILDDRVSAVGEPIQGELDGVGREVLAVVEPDAAAQLEFPRPRVHHRPPGHGDRHGSQEQDAHRVGFALVSVRIGTFHTSLLPITVDDTQGPGSCRGPSANSPGSGACQGDPPSSTKATSRAESSAAVVSSPEITGDAFDEPEEGAVEKVLPDRELLGFRDFRKASSQHITIGVAAISMTPNKNQASQRSPPPPE